MRKTLIMLTVMAMTACTASGQQVTIKSEPLILPTYELGPADPNPIFFTGRVYQGAMGRIYPYQLYDQLTDRKVDKTYNALWLENKYMKVCMLPEIGGRILSATDKTDNYEIFYRQSGIKPALIGMLGAWLSGGVEWNIPHHHRASSYMPIDWKLENNPDGSKTVWVGETELTERLKWSIGITLYPNRSYVEARVRVINQTPFVQSMLYWANVSVLYENYEVIFPPSTQFGADHSKVYFTPWPMGESVRGKGDKVNLAWWKNFTSTARSVFCWNFRDNFLAGYDHGKQAGTVHVANHNVVTGKKFFLWGNNPSGRMWDKMLSDKDGPYLELMVGAYSDNQPDYSWIAPGETREFTQRWYGIRDIKGVKNSNSDAAVNLERQGKTQMFMGFNATTEYSGAHAQLILNGKPVFDRSIRISPEHPFTTTVKVEKDAPDSAFTARLTDTDGKVLVEYTPIVLHEKPMPKVIEGTKPVKDYKTVEELYYAGLRVEQFHNARLDAMDFYREALGRDSLDSRINTAVGIRMAKEGRYREACYYLHRALARPTHDYTRVKDGEPYYYLGVVNHLLGNDEDAADCLWRATWDRDYQHPAFLMLAQMSCTKSDYTQALDLIDRSLNVGLNDTKALTTKAYILRQLGRTAEARQCLSAAKSVDPLDYWSEAEQSMLAGGNMNFLAQELKTRGKGIVGIQELLEVITSYFALGAYEDAEMLTGTARKLGGAYAKSPLIDYYEAYALLQTGKRQQCNEMLSQARNSDVRAEFPFRLEDMMIFRTLMTADPEDEYIPYYLGNVLYYLGQKDEGLAMWKKAKALGGNFAILSRNIGFGLSQQGEDLDGAIASYEMALKADPDDPRYVRELDALYEKKGVSSRDRLAFMERYGSTVMKHDDDVIRLLGLYNECGRYDDAIKLMRDRHFHVWEGGGDIHGIYVDAHILRGISSMQTGGNADAIADFSAADDYPDNLEVGRPGDGGHPAKAFYLAALTYKKMGQVKNARKMLESVATIKSRRGATENGVFCALAEIALGHTASGKNNLDSIMVDVDRLLSANGNIDAYSKFGEDGHRVDRLSSLWYVKGLCYLARGESSKAQQCFGKSSSLKPNVWAETFRNLPLKY